jgi:hypothetical protein
VEASLTVSAIALAFSLIAIVVSAILTLQQLRLMRHANLLPVLIDAFRDFRSLTFKEHLEFIEGLQDQYPPGKWGFDELPEPARTRANVVAVFFHDVGILVANGIIDDTLASSYMGRSVLRAWDSLAPYITNSRNQRNDPNLFLFFEHLAAIISQNPPAKLNKRLKLQPMPPIESARLNSRNA